MKLLCINCKPDFTWLTSKGLKLDVTYSDSPKQIYPLKALPKVINSLGVTVDMNIPDVSFSVSNIVGYNVIMVGWNPSDYDQSVVNTGGYTYPEKQPNGARLISVRVDDIPNNIYPIHEMMHTDCNFINIDIGDHVPKDFMDVTPINGIWKPYYENDYNITDPQSNFNQTWRNIIPFLDRLNKIVSLPIITLTRKILTNKEIIGELRTADGRFGCDTLELPWKNNQMDISCIPVGQYTVKKVFSLKFGFIYEVQNVPNRSGIYLHEGNYFFNSLGCILLGSLPKDINGDGQIDISNSKLIRKAFEQYLGFSSFTLLIK